MNRYFRGQALVALIVSVFFIIGFSIVGLPLAIVFGLFMGVLNMVPYLKTVAVIPALFLAFLQSAETGQSFLNIMFWLVIVFLVIQIVEDLFLVPKIMGKVTGLNPAVILLSLSVWGSLMGVVGLIIALPMTTLLISYYKRLVLKETVSEEVVAANEAEVADEVEI
jgi:predicted PurR-regulated permease PerM